jgi:stage II sporulation protein D
MSQHGALGMAQDGRSHRAILRHYYSRTQLGRTPNRLVRVLVRERSTRVRFRGATRACGRRLRSARTYAAVRDGRGVELRAASGRRLAGCGAALRATGGASVELRGRGEYRGVMAVLPKGRRSLMTVNEVVLEQYLRGVVAAEMPAGWPREALRAQAIAARTYAITTSAGGRSFDQYDDTRSQVYLGVRGEVASTNAAIRATRGRVVTYRGRPAITYFHSTSGGRTEDVELVFDDSPAHPWLRGVRDPADRVSPLHRWGPVRFSGPRLERALGDLARGAVAEIDVRRRGRVSGRIRTSQIVGSGGEATATGAQLRARLGLRDTWAFFARVTTRADGGALTGSVSPTRGTLRLQRRSGGRWVTRRRVRADARGRYRVRVRPGRWRLEHRGWAAGPSVRIPRA